MAGNNDRSRHFDRAEWLRRSHEHFLHVAQGYNAARAFEQGKLWAEEIASRVPLAEADCLLDVGCGTGLFALPFAEVLPCQIIGLDPSSAMLAEASRRDRNGRVQWLKGQAERLPFPDGFFQAIFLSQVWHHLEDDRVAAHEFHRVLKPGGGLFIKTFSHDQISRRWDLEEVFPELMPLMLNIYPDLSDFETLLGKVGLVNVAHKSYRKEDTMRPSTLLNIANEKLWSMFSYISEEGWESGMAYLRELIVETGDAPVPYDEVHLLVSARKP